MKLLHIIVLTLCLNVLAIHANLPAIHAGGGNLTNSTCPAIGWSSQTVWGFSLIGAGVVTTVGGLALIGDSVIPPIKVDSDLQTKENEEKMRCKVTKGCVAIGAGLMLTTVGWCTVMNNLSWGYKKLLNCADH